jgi:hypothetical protein
MAVGSAIAFLLVALVTLVALASDAEFFFATDKDGTNKVTSIKEGQEIYIVISDADNDWDCDIRDKIWVDLKVFDPKTGAYMVWSSWGPDGDAAYLGYVGRDGDLDKGNWLEETEKDSGIFVSNKSFLVGTRENFSSARTNTHIVGPYTGAVGAVVTPLDFQWGHYEYLDPSFTVASSTNLMADVRGWFEPRATSAAWNFVAGLMNPANEAVLPSDRTTVATDKSHYLLGRFENMDTLVGLYQDYNDAKDVALGLLKIEDSEVTTPGGAKLYWDADKPYNTYKDPRGAAKITVEDPDENLDCSRIEYVPVFVLINPGSWNAQTLSRVTNFCQLLTSGGVKPVGDGVASTLNAGPILDEPIRWYNIYDSGLDYDVSPPGTQDFTWGIPGGVKNINNAQDKAHGTYFIQYPTSYAENVTSFETTDPDGFVRVMFWAQETSVNSGIFTVRLNNLLTDLGFVGLDVGDVLVAYYLDPNDFDELRIATAYIEENLTSNVMFTDSAYTAEKNLFYLGRDNIYIQVYDETANEESCCPEKVLVHVCDPHNEDDAEWLVLWERGPSSPIFTSQSGYALLPVWDALGIGLSESAGGYQLQLDNWKLEAFNEDSIYVRYNDNRYVQSEYSDVGDVNIKTAFPPRIELARQDNDVAFDMMEVYDYQVFDGLSKTAKLDFVDASGTIVDKFLQSETVYIQVTDLDQNEDNGLRERISGWWDGPTPSDHELYPLQGQNIPFGPVSVNEYNCGFPHESGHPINLLLGDTNVNGRDMTNLGTGFDLRGWGRDLPLVQTGSQTYVPIHPESWAKIYVLNPRTGRWTAVDLFETAPSSGIFRSPDCIEISTQYPCAPSLGALPGDTVLAVYQDPSNHSDTAWRSIKVSRTSGGTAPSQAAQANFCNASGTAVTTYYDTDLVYVKVKDPSHAGATALAGAVKIGTNPFDLTPLGTLADTFITRAITLAEIGATVGQTITAKYTDPSDLADTSETQAAIIGSVLSVTGYLAKPNPFSTETFFTYKGTGIASTFTVTVYDQSGHPLWSKTEQNTTEVRWDGKDDAGMTLSNGAYIYVVVLSDNSGTKAPYKGKVFINR